MDSKSKGMAWISKICQKTETFFAEVDGFISQEPLKYVENELLTVGENVKQFCSELIQDVLDLVEEEEVPSSPEVNEKVGDLASTMNIGLGEEHPKVSCDLESSVHDLSVEPIEELNNDSPSKKQYDIGTNIEETSKSEALFSSQIREAIAFANENANDKSLSCGVRQSNIEGSDDQGNLSSVISIEVQEDSMTVSKKINNAADAKDDVSTLQPTVHSNVSGEILEHKVLNVPKDSLQSELDPFKISEEFQTLSASVVSDSTSSEPYMINHFAEQGMPITSPVSKLKLGDSCIIVDSNEIRSASECEAKHLYHQKSLRRAFSSVLKFAKEKKAKKANLSEDLNKEIYEPEMRYLTPASSTRSFESMGQEFSESEWEII